MDPGSVNEATPWTRAWGRLKAEAFYVIVFILVAIIGGVQTAKSFRGEGEGPPTFIPVDQKALRRLNLQIVAQRALRQHKAVRFYLAVARLNLCFLATGTAAVLILVYLRISRERPASLLTAAGPPWGLWDVLKVAALFAGGAQLFHWIFTTGPSRPFTLPADWMAEIFARILLIGAIIHIAIVERKGRLSDLGLRRGGGSAALVGLAAFLAVQPFMRLTEAAELRWVSPLPLQDVLQAIYVTRSVAVLTLATILAVVVTPLSEELLFRGFLQPALQRWLGPSLGILGSAAFFAAAHRDLYVLPNMLVLGLALGYVYSRSRSLAAPVALHMAYNGMVMLTLFTWRGLAAAVR